MTSTIYNAQTNLINALRLFFLAEETRLSTEHAASATVCNRFAVLLFELAALPATKATEYEAFFTFRDNAVKGMAEQYAALSNVMTQDRLRALQFNGVEIDTELIRIFLFGQNLVAMPNP